MCYNFIRPARVVAGCHQQTPFQSFTSCLHGEASLLTLFTWSLGFILVWRVREQNLCHSYWFFKIFLICSNWFYSRNIILSVFDSSEMLLLYLHNNVRWFSCFCVFAAVRQASADWGTWILHTECVNSGWTPGCTVSGTLWQPRPNDPARDCTVHREVFCARTATPSSHYHPFSLLIFSHPLYVLPLNPPSPLCSALPRLLTFFTLVLHILFFQNTFFFLFFGLLSCCCHHNRNCLLAFVSPENLLMETNCLNSITIRLGCFYELYLDTEISFFLPFFLRQAKYSWY